MKRFIFSIALAISCLTVHIHGADPEPDKKPGPRHADLAMGVGKWKWAEEAFETIWGPAGNGSFTSESRMVLGGFFNEDRGKGKGADGKPYEWFGISGYDDEKGFYSLGFDSAGHGSRPWKGEYGSGKLEGNTWTWRWTQEQKGKTYQCRAVNTFSDDRKNQTYEWHYSEDGTNWKPWLKGSGKRTRK